MIIIVIIYYQYNKYINILNTCLDLCQPKIDTFFSLQYLFYFANLKQMLSG